ncbi:hypothetical protein ABEP17_16665 [Priestia flexa]|uniref:hypothetical protein n=1 Tax=Priestia TaxID=2800373 RepID=UPI001294879E|nr:hypothetical protein [Priestia flexa]MCM3066491.1 hypothetical protein [Priestia flexa]WEZ10180.1 hypothetical protein P5663_10230 [Priestia flexa]
MMNNQRRRPRINPNFRPSGGTNNEDGNKNIISNSGNSNVNINLGQGKRSKQSQSLDQSDSGLIF